MTPGPQDLWFVPLGGCGEIGMNFNLYGHDGQWLIVDAGITFNRDEPGAPHVQMADPGFIADRRDAIAGIVVTHAHEDHVGAVAHLWRRLRAPVYTTVFTAACLARKLAEAGLAGEVPVHVVEPGERRHIGVFDVEWIALTHSVPDCHAQFIRTPAGTVFHTGDWKLDARPVVGARFPEARYRLLGRQRVDAMVCDSTNALSHGGATAEADLEPGLEAIVAAAPGRVVVSCFGSNIARLTTIGRIAARTGRHLGLLGRSLYNMVGAAQASGFWHVDQELVPPRALGYLPRETVLAVATGSQGEPRTALVRMSVDRHPDVDLEPGDTVVFSSRVIPGNERAVAHLVRRLRAKGVAVVQADDSERPIHASGHPTVEELTDMYQWVRPGLVIPVHGEPEHMAANARIAAACQVPRTLVGRNGDLFRIAPSIEREPARVPVGRLGLVQGRLVPFTPAPMTSHRDEGGDVTAR